MGGAGQPKERDAEERKAGIIHSYYEGICL